MRINPGAWAAAALLALSVSRPSGAWIPLAEGEKGRLEFETRVMFWGASAGRDSVPAGTPAQEESVQDFYLRRVRLFFRAQASSRLEIFTQFGQDNIGSKEAADESNLRIKDLYLNFVHGEGLQITVGQFKVPFLRQSLESAFNQLLLDRAALASLRPAREGSRDVGGMAWGNLGGFQYRAALFDGSDQEDANPRSSFRGTLRVSYNWFTTEPEVGYTGTTLGQKRVLQIGLQADRQDDRLDPKDDPGFTTQARDYRARAADLFYDQPLGSRWAITFEGAWLGRRDDYRDPALDARSIRGYYVQAGLLLPGGAGPGRLQLVGRYEDLDIGRGAVSGANLNRSVGLNYYGKGHDRKVQVDYTWRRESPVDLDNDEARISVVCVF